MIIRSIQNIKEALLQRVILSRGWRSNRKIVVFESDDWGMIRMKSRKVYDQLEKEGLNIKKNIYNYDALESNDDLTLLFDVLDSVKDKNGNPAILTANNIVANPDFKKIKDSNFKQYHFEPFTKTLDRYPNCDQVLKLYKEGLNRKIFKCQLHGREHLNVDRWMSSLQKNDHFTRLAFDMGLATTFRKENKFTCRTDFLDAFGGDDNRVSQYWEAAIQDSVQFFRDIHGYAPTSFIAPCYTWATGLENILHQHGLKYLQGNRVQKIPNNRYTKGIQKKYHYLGQQNFNKQIYTVRNASFEVAEKPKHDWVDSCLNEISLAFKYKKPAIISVHRLNFIGRISIYNRDNGLQQFQQLLKSILKKWSDVEFLSSDALGEIISSNN